MISRVRNSIVLTLLLFLSAYAGADTLKLQDGSTLEGKFVGSSNGIIMFETADGIQAFPQDQVAGMDMGSAAAEPEAEPEAPVASIDKSDITVPAGTRLVIRMAEGVNTQQHQAGHRFRGQLEGAIVVSGVEVAPRGTVVYGVVTSSQSARRLGGKAEFSMEFTDILIDDQMIPIATEGLAAEGEGEARNTLGRTARAAAIGGLIDGSDGAKTGAKVGAGVSLLTKGESLNVPAGTMIETALRVPLDL